MVSLSCMADFRPSASLFSAIVTKGPQSKTIGLLHVFLQRLQPFSFQVLVRARLHTQFDGGFKRSMKTCQHAPATRRRRGCWSVTFWYFFPAGHGSQICSRPLTVAPTLWHTLWDPLSCNLPCPFGCIRLPCQASSTCNWQRLTRLTVEHAGRDPASCSSILRQ